jgi:DNA invertase Pin-like site-specific DNA recombinase
MSPKKIAAPLDIYVRVSDVRGRSGDSFISPKDQEERCRALAKARGYRVGDVFTDLDVSGGKMQRPELDKAIGRIAEGVSGGILVAKLDRFARTLVGGLQTLEQINDLGGAVIVADGEFDTSTATGELVLNMMLSLAQFELRRIRETWAASKRHAVTNGIHIAPRVPPGYSRGSDRRLTLNPENAEIVRQAFAMAAAGEPYARVADHLTENGMTMPSNRVRRLLHNRVYLGEARNGHGDVNPGAHPALVDEITWNVAQRPKKDSPTLTKEVSHLLAGLARCASCGFAMRPSVPSGRTVGVYRCTTVTKHGRCPGPSTISATRLEEYVVAEFLARAGAESFAPVEQDDGAEAAAQAIVAAERSYRSALTDVALRAQIGDADHAQMVATLHQQWQDTLVAAPAPAPRNTALDIVDVNSLVERLQRDGNVKDLRELLGSAIQAVFVRPAANRRRDLPVSDRVKIVFQDDEQLELPRRGTSYSPRAYRW